MSCVSQVSKTDVLGTGKPAEQEYTQQIARISSPVLNDCGFGREWSPRRPLLFIPSISEKHKKLPLWAGVTLNEMLDAFTALCATRCKNNAEPFSAVSAYSIPDYSLDLFYSGLTLNQSNMCLKQDR
ncbi:hypothetical protein ECG_06321 [Echinococcus granulosus]|nr:hypothetical protein ECG_06321 [Echinococcus granulosus]